jgi:hypothetical protein
MRSRFGLCPTNTMRSRGILRHMSEPSKDNVLPTDSAERKLIPLFSGVVNYFPLALAAVARVSKRGNDKHNPGQTIHWSRDKSTDHEDCIARHLVDVDTLDPNTGEYEDAQALAWRALAKLQLLEERRLGKPISRASVSSAPQPRKKK